MPHACERCTPDLPLLTLSACAAVYPVNMSMLVDVELRRKLRMTMAQAVLRMPLQFLFIWLAYMQTSKSFADTATGLLARG